MHKRIKELRKYLDLTQDEFAKKLGIKRGTYTMFEIGRNPISEAYINLICRTFGASEEWIRTGNGPMIWDDAPGSGELLDIYRALLPKNRKRLLNHSKDMLEMQNEAMSKKPDLENATGQPNV